MAYSDYGGYAYRNGVRVEERSDATITPEGDVFGCPGVWPGFAALAAGGKDLYEKQKDWPSGHVVLGDGPIYVVLYKQVDVRVFRGNEKLNVCDLVTSNDANAVRSWTNKEGNEYRWLNDEYFRDNNKCCVIEVDGWKLEVFFTHEDNYYQYAKLTQPDGNVWHGWSGYGVGAGLEDAGYGYSTPDREVAIRDIWPESVSE